MHGLQRVLSATGDSQFSYSLSFQDTFPRQHDGAFTTGGKGCHNGSRSNRPEQIHTSNTTLPHARDFRDRGDHHPHLFNPTSQTSGYSMAIPSSAAAQARNATSVSAPSLNGLAVRSLSDPDAIGQKESPQKLFEIDFDLTYEG